MSDNGRYKEVDRKECNHVHLTSKLEGETVEDSPQYFVWHVTTCLDCGVVMAVEDQF